MLLIPRCGRQVGRVFLEDDFIFQRNLVVSLPLRSQELSLGYMAREECLLPTRVFLGQRSLLSSVYVSISQINGLILKYALIKPL